MFLAWARGCETPLAAPGARERQNGPVQIHILHPKASPPSPLRGGEGCSQRCHRAPRAFGRGAGGEAFWGSAKALPVPGHPRRQQRRIRCPRHRWSCRHPRHPVADQRIIRHRILEPVIGAGAQRSAAEKSSPISQGPRSSAARSRAATPARPRISDDRLLFRLPAPLMKRLMIPTLNRAMAKGKAGSRKVLARRGLPGSAPLPPNHLIGVGRKRCERRAPMLRRGTDR